MLTRLVQRMKTYLGTQAATSLFNLVVAFKMVPLKNVHFQGVICCYTVAQLSLLLFLLFHIFSSLGKTNYNYKSMYFFNLCTPFTCFHFVFTIYDS